MSHNTFLLLFRVTTFGESHGVAIGCVVDGCPPLIPLVAEDIPRKLLPDVTIRGALVQIGPHKIDRGRWDWDEVGRNPFFCPDKATAEVFEQYLDGIRKSGSSIGAVIEIVADGVPAGWGAPIYGK